VRVTYGEPYVPPAGPASGSTRELMARITALVERAIAEEGAPPGSWWVPAEHGGGAPRLAEVDARLEAQVEERRERRRGAAQDAADGRSGPSGGPSSDPSV
jgi:hypothetical protein